MGLAHVDAQNSILATDPSHFLATLVTFLSLPPSVCGSASFMTVGGAGGEAHPDGQTQHPATARERKSGHAGGHPNDGAPSQPASIVRNTPHSVCSGGAAAPPERPLCTSAGSTLQRRLDDHR